MSSKKKQMTFIQSWFKKVKNEEGEESEIENEEYKDLVNKGGYTVDYSEPINVTEKKYIYGGLFTENFIKSSKNLNISSSLQQLKVSLNGNVGYKDDQEEQVNFSLGKTWKFENTINREGSVYKLYENGREKFSYTTPTTEANIISQTRNTRQQFNSELKLSIDSATNGNINDSLFQQYTNKAYSDFISLIYEKITKLISEDGLLQPINLASMNGESYITGISDSLAGIFPGFENITSALANLPPMVSPFVDTPMKYINFSPKPTREQKNSNIDPSLYGKLEVEQLVYNILEKREKEIINLKTLQEALKDDDNNINFSLIDGMYFSLIRGICIELAMRAIFPLRVFKFDKSIIEDLMIPTYGSDILYAEIQQYANSINKSSMVELTQKHIAYLHDFVYASKISAGENRNLFTEINEIKSKIVKLEEDKDIISSYYGKFYTTINLSQQDREYKQKLTTYLSCLKQEIAHYKEKLCKLQMRNLIYNEMVVVLDKLSYLTSTNEKVKSDLGVECQERDNNEQQANLQTLITDALLRSSLHEVTSIPKQTSDGHGVHLGIGLDHLATSLQTQAGPQGEEIISLQNKKFPNSTNLILEHYINIPLIKQQYSNYRVTQQNDKIFGVTTFSEAGRLFDRFPEGPISQYFSGPITYGMRMVYVPSKDISQETSVEYDNEHDALEQIKDQNKNKFIVVGDNNQRSALNFVLKGQTPINEYEKTYSIPYLSEPDSEGKIKLGLINAFPIVTEELELSNIGVSTASEAKEFITTIQNTDSNQYTNLLKARLNCNERLANFYKLLTNNNLLSNMMIFSSVGILANEEIKLNFSSPRTKLMSRIATKLTYTYNEDDFAELMDKMGSTQYFKEFNAELALKLSIRAAIYVLQYYCQMTDPNISIALLIRNAIKIALSVASQIPGAQGNIPSELPLPLTPLAIYSMAQLPITVFGVPPVGIGVGPPLTIPGMVLLGAEALLLALEFSFDMDANSNNEKINKELKDMCFDLAGYKKYGIE
jgi:hypothetical protein